MGHPDRESVSGATTGVVIVLVAIAVLAIPCIGGILLLGLFSFRAVSVPIPAPPPMVVSSPDLPLLPVPPVIDTPAPNSAVPIPADAEESTKAAP